MLRGPLAIAAGGLIAMAFGLGFGRFLYTPVLPMMVAGTGLGPSAAGLIASANLAGYLVGALAASLPVFARYPYLSMVIALVGGALATAGMALTADVVAWSILRFVGGVVSAFVLVLATSIVITRLKAAGREALAPVHFAGVGFGIGLSALISGPWIARADDWQAVWLAGGALTALSAIAVLVLIPARAPVDRAGVESPPEAEPTDKRIWPLMAAYCCFGFGYIIMATFIVAILREGEVGRLTETTVWLLVGIAAVPSVMIWNAIGRRIGMVGAYAAAMLVAAAGGAVSAVSTGPVAMAVAAAALGGTFMGIVALGLQEAARRAVGGGQSVLALMTAWGGVGQIIGPTVAGVLRDVTGSYAAPSLLASAVLFAGAAILWPLVRDQERIAMP